MIAAVAMAGAVLGALVRNVVDVGQRLWLSVVISVVGGLLLGAVVGWLVAVAPPTSAAALLTAGLGAAMLTFGVCTPAAAAVVRGERERIAVAAGLAVCGVVAGMAGAGLGAVVG